MSLWQGDRVTPLSHFGLDNNGDGEKTFKFCSLFWSITILIFGMKMECTQYIVRTETLHIMQVKFDLEKQVAFRGTIRSYGGVQNRVNWVLLNVPLRPNGLSIISNFVSQHWMTVVKAASISKRKHQNNFGPWSPLCHVIFWNIQ